MKTVLYVNGKLGVWVGFERGDCVHVHAECLYVGQAAYQPCKWLGSKNQFVHFVIDSEQAEIDAYPLQASGTPLRQLSHRNAFLKTLVDRFPDAIIRTPAKSTGLDTLLVQKVSLSEQSRRWLAYVEKSAITFCSVTTSAESVADLFASSDQPYLVLSNVMGYCKHTFCRSGHALFTRTLEHTVNFSIASGLEETLSHLRTTELIDSPVRVYLIGLSDQQLAAAAGLEWVDELVLSDETTPFEVAAKYDLDDNTGQFNAVIQIARQVLHQMTLRQHSSKRYVSLPLTKHLQKVRHRRSLCRLAALSVLAMCSAAYSGSRQWDFLQRQNDYNQTNATLSVAIDQARDALFDESPIGPMLSDALSDAQVLNSRAGPSPVILFSIIASVFTEHRELVLQELSWITVDEEGAGESGPGNEAWEPVTARNRNSTELVSPSKLLVNVVGNSSSLTTLREQQAALNSVVAMLERYSSVDNLVVLEAPLARATSDDLIGADALDLATSFRFQFYIDRVPPSEV